MEALAFLRQDHKSVLGMLQVLDGAPRGTGAAMSGLSTMVENLIIAESQHEAIEEQFFWPMVRQKVDGGDQLADRAVEQEQQGKRALQQLLDSEPGQVQYHDALQEFVAAAREHIGYEQEVVWPLFAAAVSLDERERLGRQLEDAKKVAPTRPHPGTPPSALIQKTIGAGAAIVDHLRDAATGRSEKNPPDPQTH